MSLLLLWSLLSPSFACTTPGNVLMGAWPDGRSEVPLDSQILLWFYSSPEQYTATLLDAEGAEVSAEIVYDDSARFRGWRILPDAPLAPENACRRSEVRETRGLAPITVEARAAAWT